MPFFQKVTKHHQNSGFLKAHPLSIDNKAMFVTTLSAETTEELGSR